MHYDYVPITHRGPLKWPGNKRVALIITINLETWDLVKDTDRPYYAGGPPILPDVLPGNTPDFPNFTWREYGQRVGVFRMFETFDEMKVRPSCTINAVTALRRRPMLEAALARGCEILAHNYEQGELLTDFAADPAKEREVIERTLAVYEQHVGRKARGWPRFAVCPGIASPARRVRSPCCAPRQGRARRFESWCFRANCPTCRPATSLPRCAATRRSPRRAW